MSKALCFWSARARPRFGRVRHVAPGRKRRHAAALHTRGAGSGWTLIGGTYYVYDGKRVIQERNTNNTPTVSYSRGNDLRGSMEGAGGIGGLLERADGYNSSTGTWTNHNFYHADGNGNITCLESNVTQTVAASYRYDAYGNTLASSGTLANSNTYRFSSKEFIPTAGLYYYLYRFYDPALQRWINRDPIGEAGGPGLYIFVGNRAINALDPLGLKMNNLDCAALRNRIASVLMAAQAAEERGDAIQAQKYQQTADRLETSHMRNCEDPPNPPDPPCKFGPAIVPPINNPNQNNKSFCSNHPWVCGGVGVTIGVVAVCTLQPELCAGAIQIGITIVRAGAPVAIAAGG